jgi:pimeloyl-ACP methyl ester carboxylesterase
LPPAVKTVPTNVACHGHFHIGGEYVGDPDRRQMIGQMYVEVWAPRRILHPYPIVFFHGFGGSGATWMQTADGRKGWADYFVDKGYAVYITDGPARGRSLYNAERQPKQSVGNTADSQRTVTNTRERGDWPQAKLHTQYPGTGRPGDPVFDAAFARGVASIADNAEQQRLVQKAAAALLDRIGPAILVTHSKAGPFGWLIADARPKLVRGIVAVEPGGPPFEDTVLRRGPSRAWGVSDIPMTYDPPAASPEELKRERDAAAEGPDLAVCMRQAAPARRLPNLVGIPIAILTGEASYHAVYDHCTANYLAQAGVANEHIRLERKGIRGNGHGMPNERNNLEMAALVAGWLKSKGL